ncbi:hypothetical protein AMTR_s00035p00014070 [Amborella trichopoda]|uniref:Uncharacterized protein n=1 Tax=Amborella trichopoda TaxID=13333 RepID=W1PW20_AMBTC|nr:hypothetical protein AMTR_s00035p00014070 [Amborella trichopoda]
MKYPKHTYKLHELWENRVLVTRVNVLDLLLEDLREGSASGGVILSDNCDMEYLAKPSESSTSLFDLPTSVEDIV